MTQKKKRNSNIELLRILAMFMIVIYHIVCHCINVQLSNPESLGKAAVSTFNHPFLYKRLLILHSIMPFGPIGNALFMLIAGYFDVNRGGDIVWLGHSARKLLMQLACAAVLLVCIPPFVHYLEPAVYTPEYSITLFNGMSWFVGYYFLVVLCGTLFLNSFLQKCSKEKYLAFLWILFAIIQFSWSSGLLDALAGGLRTLATGLFLYSLGGYIHKFKPFQKVRTYFFFIVILFTFLMILVSAHNTSIANIENYYRNGGSGEFIQSIPGYDNTSIAVIIPAVCLFELFTRLHLPQNRVITFLGRSTFMVYLIHDNDFFYYLWNRKDWITALSNSSIYFVLSLLKWAGCTFLIGIAAYAFYNLLSLIFPKIQILIKQR